MNYLPPTLAAGLALACACLLPAAEPAAKKPKTDIQKSMEKMDDAFALLRKEAGDPSKNADSLDQIETLRTEAQKARTLTPGPAAGEPESARPVYLEEYRKRMGNLIEQLGAIEQAIQAGDNARAEKLVAEMRGFVMDAHRDFKKPKPGPAAAAAPAKERDALKLQSKRATDVKEAGKVRNHTKLFDLSGIPEYVPQQKVSGKLRVWGLNYMGDCGLAAMWADGFRKYQPDLEIEYYLPTALVAIPGLIAHAADLGATRPMTFDDRLTFQRIFDSVPGEIKMVNSSYDVGGYAPAQGILVPVANPVKGLSLKQLDGIFGTARSGGYVGITWHPEFARGPEENIRVWGQVGLTGRWTNSPINPYMVTLRYHDPNVFEDVALQGSDLWNENLREFNTYLKPDGSWYSHGEQILEAMEKDPFSIGVIIMNDKLDLKKVKILPIATKEGGPYVAPSLESVHDLKYPLINYEWWIFPRKPGTAVDPRIREYLRYVLSREGQDAVQRNGKFLPLTAEVAREELRKLD